MKTGHMNHDFHAVHTTPAFGTAVLTVLLFIALAFLKLVIHHIYQLIS